MSAEVCTRRGAPVVILALAALVAPATAFAQSASATFKVAYFNVQSGKGEPALPGRVASFVDTANCTDTTQPLNAWGTGFFQEHLVKSIKNDPKIVAMGLGESWPSVCASPENIRKVLGWKSKTSSQNGVAMVAKYGFVGAEEWVQLDTSLNTNPADTMWALRMTVCLNEMCSQTISVFTAHWLGAGTYKNTMVDRQAKQTVDFMQRTAGLEPHVFTADLNAWEGVPACGQNPNGTGLNVLRGAGYVDAWPLLHGSAEGFTGMTNRVKCGVPEGYGWKRPDYTWAAPHFLPISMTRFGIVTPGEDAPSDHYGLITEFPMPGPVATVDVAAPSVALASPSNNLAISGGSVVIAADAVDDSGVTRVEIIENGVVAHTLTSAPYQVTCSSLAERAGTHTVAARAFDAAGNAGVSDTRNVVVSTADTSTPDPIVADGDIVLYAKDATLVSGKWQVVSDTTAAGAARAWIPDASVAKLGAALAAPADFFELTFNAEAGKPYRLWMRGRADNDYWGNDSAFFQFSGSVTSTGAPVFRIGSDSATWLGVEDCSGCALRGWGWQDNGYGAGVLGPVVYFAVSGPQTVRVQRREDGLSIDQIVLSP